MRPIVFAIVFAGLSGSSLSSQALPIASQTTFFPAAVSLRDTLTAQPLTREEKLRLRIGQQFGWPGIVGAGLGSSLLQLTDKPRQWGQGAGAYGERYASSFGTGMTYRAIAFGVETALKEDPRYFPSSKPGFQARLKAVLLETFLTKKDDGTTSLAYSRLAGAYGSGFVQTTWRPSKGNLAVSGLVRGSLSVAGGTAFNFFQEFFPFTRNGYFRQP